MPAHAHDLPPPGRPHLHLVASPPEETRRRARRWTVIAPRAGVLLGMVAAESTGAIAGASFVQDIVLTSIPVVGGMALAVVEGLRRRRRAGRDEMDARRLDDEYHKDLRRQIARLERQVDDLARRRAGRPLRGEPPDGPA